LFGITLCLNLISKHFNFSTTVYLLLLALSCVICFKKRIRHRRSTGDIIPTNTDGNGDGDREIKHIMNIDIESNISPMHSPIKNKNLPTAIV